MIRGIVRKINGLGRITLPREYLGTLGIVTGEQVDMYLDGCIICVKPVRLQYVFCGSDKEDQLIKRNGVHVCKDCVGELFIGMVDELFQEVVE